MDSQRPPRGRSSPAHLAGLAACLAISLAPAAMAQEVLFSDNFDTDTSGNWNVFDGSADGTSDYTVDFAFDYGVVTYTSGGVSQTIPPAPGSSGTTRGVKLTVNNNDDVAATAGVSLFPKNATFSGAYALRADVWMNYNGGAFGDGGTGTTEFATFGLNHGGGQVVWDNESYTADGIWFAATGEGGASRDYRSYVGDGFGPSLELDVVLGGFLDRNGDGVAEREVNPSAADALNPLNFILPAPPGETRGAPGKQWVQVEVRQQNGPDDLPTVTWLINGHVIAEHQQGIFLGQAQGNVMIGMMDVFASIANPAADNFVIFDNVEVVSLEGVAPKPVVSIVADDADAAEPSDSATVTISRQGDTSGPLTVGLRPLGTATPDEDYVAVPDEVTIPAGQESVTLTIATIDDQAGEGDETIIVALAGSEAYDIRENTAAIITLMDDGDVPAASVAAVKPVAYELKGTRSGQFAIRLSTPPLSDVTVNYTIAGTAVSGTDYEPLTGSVTILAPDTEAVIALVPKDNTLIDGDRTVELTVTAGSGYKLESDLTATVTIRNDDLVAGQQVLYSETFDTDASSRWAVNAGPGDGVADLFFDYSTVGVPPAPRSSGSTRGLKLQANLTSATFSGLSVSPLNEEFPGNLRLRFDLWQNYNGPLNGGGSGSTQITGAGVGTAGTSAQWPGGTQDSVWFATTGDGGSSVDYRAYSSAAAGGYADDSGVFAAGTTGSPRNQSHPYYAEFGGNTAPEEQVAGFPDQGGISLVGSQAFQWHDVVIEKVGGTVTWFIDGLRLATVPLTDVTMGGNNILFAHSDINAGSSTDPNAEFMAFGLIDNVTVEALEAAAGPATITAIAVSGAQATIEFTGADSDVVGTFGLVAADTVQGPYASEPAATIEQVSPGRFRATVPATSAARFFQVVR